MRKKAVVTESSTWFAALGFKTLKEQETTLREGLEGMTPNCQMKQ